ncbi:MAG: MFS transporter [Thalassobaculum sp.]|uniref:MFS transporter n=1 Tax=Thalassobaculum sp. TaxID=2022740 RepID=UPI0032ED6233
MPGPIASIAALLLSIGLLQAANGLFGSLLGVRLGLDPQFSASVAGLVLSGYFVGLVLGCLTCGRIIERVGHVRAFAALVSIVSATAVAHAFAVEPVYWFVLRVAFGFCMAGVYMVAESWMNGAATNATRGALLSIYMVVQYGAMGAGQFLLNLSDPASFVLYGVASILFSLALVPITLARSAASGEVGRSALGFIALYRISPLGIVGSFGSGTLSGAVFATASVYAATIGMAVSQIAIFVSSGILGGLVVQWPLGKLSDRFDRRTVLTGCFFAAAVLAAVLAFSPGLGFWPFVILAGAYGGVAVTLYSIAVAHANDHIEANDLVAASAGLLLAYSLGAVIGPIASTNAIALVGPSGFYGFGVVVATLVGLFALWRMTRRAAPEDQGPFVAVPRTSPMVSDLDPRAEPADDEMPGQPPVPS